MPRVCTICQHPQRAAIDAALVAGESFRNIAQRFETSPTALYRHKESHIAPALAKAQDAAEVARGDTLLDQVRDLQARALTILATAEVAGDLRVALSAIREARCNLELLAKLLGELAAQPVDNSQTNLTLIQVLDVKSMSAVELDIVEGVLQRQLQAHQVSRGEHGN